MSVVFTILLPVHRSADLLQYAIESVLSQTIKDFELFVICDGAPLDTIACAEQFATQDSRIKVFPFPKGQRHGEAHRHTALQQAKGRFVAQIADDDLWFPNHLEEMAKLLEQVDFGNLMFCCVELNAVNYIHGLVGDLSDPFIIEKMKKTKFNFFGPTTAGYTMSAYRQLSQGWSPAPEDLWTDLFMWRKFLATPGLTFGTRMAVTSCHFPAHARAHLSIQDRRKEMSLWFENIQCQKYRDQLVQQVLKRMNREVYVMQEKYINLQHEMTSLFGSLSWRLTKPLRVIKSRLSL